jgi:hypothetical protein
MIEFLLIWASAHGHVNAQIDKMTADRFRSQPACEAELERRRSARLDGNGVCFPVAALPKEKGGE